MRAMVVRPSGGPQELTLQDVALPQPGAGEVLIQVAYAGVKPSDFMFMPQMQGPLIPGHEVAGSIYAIGSGVEGLSLGQPVMALLPSGGYAEFATAKAALTFPLDGLSLPVDLATAAAFPTTVPVAYDLITRAARVQPGETVLIHAAAGGIGVVAMQLARLQGARAVLGTVRDGRKAEAVRSLGYDEIFIQEGFAQGVASWTGGRGVDVVLDPTGEPTRSQSLSILAPGGRLVVFGNLSGNPEVEVSPHLLWQTNKAIVGYSFTTQSRTAPTLMVDSVTQSLALLAAGKIALPIGAIFSLGEAAAAHRSVRERATHGELLLRVNAMIE